MLQKAMVSSLSAPSQSQSCFAVDFRGPGISASTPRGECSGPVGIRSGFVASGSPLVIDVPRGSDREMRLFLFKRPAGAACPSIDEVLSDLSKYSSLYLMGQVSGISLNNEQESVEVTASYPGDAAHLASNLPSTCNVSGTPGAGGIRQVSLILGSSEVQNANGKVKVKIKTTGVVR